MIYPSYDILVIGAGAGIGGSSDEEDIPTGKRRGAAILEDFDEPEAKRRKLAAEAAQAAEAAEAWQKEIEDEETEAEAWRRLHWPPPSDEPTENTALPSTWREELGKRLNVAPPEEEAETLRGRLRSATITPETKRRRSSRKQATKNKKMKRTSRMIKTRKRRLALTSCLPLPHLP